MDITIYDNDFRQVAYYYTRLIEGDAYDDEITDAYKITDRHGFTNRDGDWIHEENE